jgi:hypothetical protein
VLHIGRTPQSVASAAKASSHHGTPPAINISKNPLSAAMRKKGDYLTTWGRSKVCVVKLEEKS